MQPGKSKVTSYIQAYDKNIDIHKREIAFDRSLWEKAQIKQEARALQLSKGISNHGDSIQFR